MEPTFDLPAVASIDDLDSPGDVLRLVALERFLAGDEPFAATRTLTRVRADARLMPAGTEPLWSATHDNQLEQLARGDGWTILSRRWSNGAGDITVTAADRSLAESILEAAARDAEEPITDERSVIVRFWHNVRNGGWNDRTISADRWSAIRRNYESGAADAFDALTATDPTSITGRIVLLHGPPGTGKTTALRALALEWRPWCRLEVVIDPEKLLSDGAYLTRFLLGDDDEHTWRLVVLEDCDELLRSDAKQGTGQALSRLLNVSDGLLGQGTRLLIAMTTNEPIHRLHPAVIRPGRCLAEVAVDRLPRREALRWLGRTDGVGPDGATLAELFALRGEIGKVERAATEAATGQYL
jgi:hypothetical protein